MAFLLMRCEASWRKLLRRQRLHGRSMNNAAVDREDGPVTGAVHDAEIAWGMPSAPFHTAILPRPRFITAPPPGSMSSRLCTKDRLSPPLLNFLGTLRMGSLDRRPIRRPAFRNISAISKPGPGVQLAG
jgi:hypothetical protein